MNVNISWLKCLPDRSKSLDFDSELLTVDELVNITLVVLTSNPELNIDTKKKRHPTCKDASIVFYKMSIYIFLKHCAEGNTQYTKFHFKIIMNQ